MHYLYEELDRYYNGDMNFFKRLICKRHLAKCSQCSKLLERIKSDNELLNSAQKSFDSKSEYL